MSNITVQFSYGTASVTCQLEDLPYSPDVYQDVLKQGVRALAEVIGEKPDTISTKYKVYTLDEFLERFEDKDEDDDD